MEHITRNIKQKKHTSCSTVPCSMFNVQCPQRGQTIIILVMVVAIVALIMTHVSTINLASLTRANELTEGDTLRMKAEGYTENASLRFLRDSSYTGETLNDSGISCTMVVADIGGGITDFETTCTESGRTRIVGMQATYLGGVFTFTKIGER